MAFNKYHSFSSLNDTTSEWIIRVRAQSIWKGITKKTGEFRGYNIIFFDDSSERIHAFITSQIVPKFEKDLLENQIYIVQNFKVKEFTGDETNRAVRYHKHIFFTGDTLLQKDFNVGMTIPDYSFDFYSLQDMDAMKNDNRFLTDIVAVIQDVQPKVVYNTEGVEKSHVPLTVTDGRTSLNVTLFNEMGDAFMKAREQLVDEAPIIIIASGKISEWKAGLYMTNFPATRFYLNLKHPAVTALRARQSQPNFYPMDIEDVPEPVIPVMKVADIRKLNQDFKENKVTCEVTVKKFDENMSWFTPFCTKCEEDIVMVNSIYKCTTCKRTKLYPDKRFRLFSLCSDETGSMPIIWPNDEICRLTGKCVYDVETDDPEVESGKKLPPILKCFEKKIYQITLNLTEDNLKEGSNIYHASQIFQPMEMTATHSPSTKKTMQVEATEISNTTTNKQILSNLSSPPTAKSSNKSRPRSEVEKVEYQMEPDAKILKLKEIKTEKNP